jgi:hypothetical protein
MMLPKKKWNSMGREFPLVCLLPSGRIGLMRLCMDMSEEWKIKEKKRSS